MSKENHKDEDCILIAVLTHGKNDSGKDKLYAHDFEYDVDTIWSYFTADMCPSLAGKPKIFIIQVSLYNISDCLTFSFKIISLQH